MRLATALLLLAGGLVATGTQHDTPAVAVSAGKHRPAPPPRASRSMRRTAVPHRVNPGLPAGKARHRHRAAPVAPTVPHDLRGGVRQLLTVTAYCWTGNRNAAGNWPTLGTAAANAYPIGTRLHVQGYGVVVVEDRSAPGATDVDIYLGTGTACDRAAAAWGRRQLYVTEVAA